MADDEREGPLRVELPERLDRRMRLGPFDSVASALKFAAYAAVGAVAASLVGPAGWVPFVGVGFLAATYRYEGKALDERVVDYLAYGARRLRGERARRSGDVAMTGARWLRTPSGRRVAVLAAGGIPVAFLPSQESRRLFESYYRALRGCEASLYLVVGVAPLRERTLRPPKDPGSGGAPDAAARVGYDELVTALALRRARRRVTIAVWSPTGGASEEERLERSVHALLAALQQLEVPVRRLEGRALEIEAGRLGLAGGVA